MFTKFSLCPGGAFMMHESAAEYDPNIVADVASEVPAEVAAQIKAEPSYDPVMKLISKTKPLYEEMLQLASLQAGDAQETVQALERVSAFASKLADKMRMQIIKQSAVHQLFNIDRNAWIYESLKTNLGMFMLHEKRLEQLGYDKMSYNSSGLMGSNEYDINHALDLYTTSTKHKLVTLPVSLDVLRDTGYSELLSSFNDMEDLLRCMYYDPERLARCEYATEHTLTLHDMMFRISDDGYSAVDRGLDKQATELIKYLSAQLRLIQQTIYTIQCDLTEPVDTVVVVNHDNEIHKVLSTVFDMMYVPMLYLIPSAYHLRMDVNMRAGITEYVQTALNGLGYVPK